MRESEREREREREKERERERRTDGRKKGRDSKKKKVLEQNDKWKGKKNNKHQHDRKPRRETTTRISEHLAKNKNKNKIGTTNNKKNTHCLFVRLFDFAPVPRALVSLRCKLPHRPDVGERLLCHRRGL